MGWVVTKKEQLASLLFEKGRTVYVHVVTGTIMANGEQLQEGDGATIKDVDVIEFIGMDNSEALIFDLP